VVVSDMMHTSYIHSVLSKSWPSTTSYIW